MSYVICTYIPEKYENSIRSRKIDEWNEAMDLKLVQCFEKWKKENLENADQSYLY